MNFNAFESRFRTIFSHMSRSRNTGSSIVSHATSKRMPACSIAERNAPAISRVRPLMSVGP
ncbi:hypothetical protein D3C83_74090 [compost metagenome]